jgi:pyruvate formate lyase activating enzyme
MLYEVLADNAVRCNLCSRRCRIPEGKPGFCLVRKNIEGKLYTLTYGKACSANVDPIEKKPLSHFHPGSLVFSIATIGCNWRCRFCQNWVISQDKEVSGTDLDPEKVVSLAKSSGCQGISYTYTEPTIFFEYAYDTSRIAHREKLFNTFVTNGYETPEAIRMIGPYLDAATVDFKGAGDEGFLRKFSAVPSAEPIFDALKEFKNCGVHLEITNLVVPKYGDSLEAIRKLAKWIRENLGPEVPFHLLRFHPDYELLEIPATPIATLEQAWRIAKEEGLYYVYAGNVPGHKLENTYCPQCRKMVVERFGFQILKWNLLEDNRCPECGFKLHIIGGYSKSSPRPTFF